MTESQLVARYIHNVHSKLGEIHEDFMDEINGHIEKIEKLRPPNMDVEEINGWALALLVCIHNVTMDNKEQILNEQ